MPCIDYGGLHGVVCGCCAVRGMSCNWVGAREGWLAVTPVTACGAPARASSSAKSGVRAEARKQEPFWFCSVPRNLTNSKAHTPRHTTAPKKILLHFVTLHDHVTLVTHTHTHTGKLRHTVRGSGAFAHDCFAFCVLTSVLSCLVSPLESRNRTSSGSSRTPQARRTADTENTGSSRLQVSQV